MSARLARIALYVTLACVAVISLFPIWFLIATSLKPPIDIGGSSALLYPEHLTWSNYDILFTQRHMGRRSTL